MSSYLRLYMAAALALQSLGLAAADGDTFTVNCNPLTVQRSDPIISPGKMSSHVHAVVGGTAFAQSLSNQQATDAQGTTCDKKMDHSNYWVPQLYEDNGDGTYTLVKHKGTAAYYQNRACDYQQGETSCPDGSKSAAPPKGLRMVSGNPDLRTFDKNNIEQRAVNFMCIFDGGSKEYNSLPPRDCTDIRAQVTFPSCWNGQDVTSEDNKSHMSFPEHGDYNGGVCPESHPKAIIEVFYEFHFDTSSVQDHTKLVFAQGDRTGYGYHGDYINGWTDLEALGRAHETCTGSGGVDDPNCSLIPKGESSPGSASDQQLETPAPQEDVGFDGPVKGLPGGNKPTGEPVTAEYRKRSRVFDVGY